MYKRTWIITGEVTRDDLEWVLRSKLSFMQGRQQFTPAPLLSLREPSTITTTNEKEETWLKLYFADRTILIAEEVMYKYE
jgi:hypothetical protein